MLLLIDNYDSFTYNLAHLFGELGVEVVVRRNDEITVDEAERLAPSHLVISPGPGPAGGRRRVRGDRCGRFAGPRAGARRLPRPPGDRRRRSAARSARRRRSSTARRPTVGHDGRGIFAGLPEGFAAGRYHSLAATSVPDCLEVSATAADGEVMAVRHRELRVDGVQFHPESVLTPDGPALARNFLERS